VCLYDIVIEQETFTDDDEADDSCPNLLIRKNGTLLLYNTKKHEDENNPMSFPNLDEYINYLEIQRNQGNSCPILFLQQETNTQGEETYRIRPSPFDSSQYTQPNIDSPAPITNAEREHPPYNIGNYPAFDPQGQDVGKYNQLDKIHDSTNRGPSDNPMDSNWGGVTLTQKMVDSGKYDKDQVVKPILGNVRPLPV